MTKQRVRRVLNLNFQRWQKEGRVEQKNKKITFFEKKSKKGGGKWGKFITFANRFVLT